MCHAELHPTFMQEYDLIPFDYLRSQSISQYCVHRRYIKPVIFFRFIFETGFSALLNSKTCNECNIPYFFVPNITRKKIIQTVHFTQWQCNLLLFLQTTSWHYLFFTSHSDLDIAVEIASKDTNYLTDFSCGNWFNSAYLIYTQKNVHQTSFLLSLMIHTNKLLQKVIIFGFAVLRDLQVHFWSSRV